MSTLSSSKLSATLTAAVLVVAGMTVTAQAQINQQVRVQVPFAFEQGSTHLAAGQYTISLQTGNLLLIRGDKESAYSMANTDQSLKPADKGKVVFERYGNRYFIHQIWMAGTSTHIDCVKSREEKSLQKELNLASVEKKSAGVEVAVLETSR